MVLIKEQQSSISGRTGPNSDRSLDKKGVPGFSLRLGQVFDRAGAPDKTRLSWGAKRWNVVPNTIGNWLKYDIAPSNHGTLMVVLNDLIELSGEKVDVNEVVGWLYSGGANPFNKTQQSSQPIDHMLQIRIFNILTAACKLKNWDVNRLPLNLVNTLINDAYIEFSNSTHSLKNEEVTTFLMHRLSSSSFIAE